MTQQRFELLFDSDGGLHVHLRTPVDSLSESEVTQIYGAMRAVVRVDSSRRFHALWFDDDKWNVVGGPYRTALTARNRAGQVAKETPHTERRIGISEYDRVVAVATYTPGRRIRFVPASGERIDLEDDARFRHHTLTD